MRYFMKLSPLWLAIIAILMGCQPIAPPTTQNSSPLAQPLSSEFALLQELMVRTITYTEPSTGKRIPPQIFLGTIPENFPYKLYIPKDAEIIGSIFYEEIGGGQIFFSTSEPVGDVLKNMAIYLLEQGFISLVDLSGPEIERAFNPFPDGLFLCAPNRENDVIAIGHQNREGANDIVVSLEYAPGGPCTMANR